MNIKCSKHRIKTIITICLRWPCGHQGWKSEGQPGCNPELGAMSSLYLMHPSWPESWARNKSWLSATVIVILVMQQNLTMISPYAIKRREWQIRESSCIHYQSCFYLFSHELLLKNFKGSWEYSYYSLFDQKILWRATFAFCLDSLLL